MLTQRGFTIIELVVAVAIVAILAMVGLPSYSIWMQNLRIRGATEAVQSSLQLARSSAVGRNLQTNMSFTTGTPVSSVDHLVYTVLSPASPPASFQNPPCAVPPIPNPPPANSVDCIRQITGEGPNVVVTMTPADAYMVTFGTMGQVVNNLDGSSTPTQIDFTSAVSADTAIRPLRILIRAGGRIMTCDPNPGITATDARFCAP
jgi:type IV fimbrial biogenesis protein FimT